MPFKINYYIYLVRKRIVIKTSISATLVSVFDSCSEEMVFFIYYTNSLKKLTMSTVMENNLYVISHHVNNDFCVMMSVA